MAGLIAKCLFLQDLAVEGRIWPATKPSCSEDSPSTSEGGSPGSRQSPRASGGRNPPEARGTEGPPSQRNAGSHSLMTAPRRVQLSKIRLPRSLPVDLTVTNSHRGRPVIRSCPAGRHGLRLEDRRWPSGVDRPAAAVLRPALAGLPQTPADRPPTLASLPRRPAGLPPTPVGLPPTPADRRRTPADLSQTPASRQRTPAGLSQTPAGRLLTLFFRPGIDGWATPNVCLDVHCGRDYQEITGRGRGSAL
jgi:hypothetical protein